MTHDFLKDTFLRCILKRDANKCVIASWLHWSLYILPQSRWRTCFEFSVKIRQEIPSANQGHLARSLFYTQNCKLGEYFIMLLRLHSEWKWCHELGLQLRWWWRECRSGGPEPWSHPSAANFQNFIKQPSRAARGSGGRNKPQHG